MAGKLSVLIVLVQLGLCLVGQGEASSVWGYRVVNASDQWLGGNGTVVKLRAIEKEISDVLVEVTYSTSKPATLTCRMDYLKVSGLVHWTDLELAVTNDVNATLEMNLTIRSIRLGGSRLLCGAKLDNSNSTAVMTTVLEMIVSRVQRTSELVFRVCVIVLVILITFVMGCGLDRHIVFGYLRAPVSPMIGFVSQFLFMPLLACALSKATGIENAFGLGLLTLGCSPGGGASNVWTVLLGGDLNLSMTMTFLSTVAALGMMPLWLFLLGRFFIDPSTVSIPYGSIMINLVQVVLPAGLGILFRFKYESAALWVADRVKMLGLLFVLFVLTFGTYANLYIYQLMGDYPYIVPIGASLPWLGFTFGGLFALVARRKRQQCVTIALETGFQNVGIAILILKFSMPQPSGDLGTAMPLTAAIFTPLPLLVVLVVLMIRSHCCKKEGEMNVEKRGDGERKDEQGSDMAPMEEKDKESKIKKRGKKNVENKDNSLNKENSEKLNDNEVSV